MRALPAAVLGSLLLLLGIVAPADAAGTAPAPTPPATAVPEPSTTPEPEPSATATPEPSATATPEPSATATPDPGDEDPGEGDPFEDIASGTFTRTPASGPAGTTISLTSATPCAGADGAAGSQVEVLLLGESDLGEEDDAPTVDKFIPTDAEGGWTTTVTVPAAAKPGEIYGLIAACFADGPIGEETLPLVIYDPQLFTVTTAVKSPVATPIVDTPTFTG